MKRWLLPLLTGLGLGAGCAGDPPLGGPGTGVEGDLLVVAGLQRLHVRSADAPWPLLWETGVGQAAGGLLPVADRLFVLSSLSHQLQAVARSGDSLVAGAAWDLGLAQGGNPYDLAWHDGRLLVTELLAGQVSAWDAETGGRLGAFPTAVAPEGLLVDGERLYVVGSNFDFQTLSFRRGWLLEHDAASGALRDSLQLGVNPQFLAQDPHGRLHVTCTGDYGGEPGEIWIVAPDPLRVEHVLACPQGFPGRIQLAPWGRAYVAAGGWAGAGAEHGLLLTYSWETGADLDTLRVGRGAIDVAVDAERGGVWALAMDEPCLDWLPADASPRSRLPLPEPAQRLVLWPREP